jgi:sec-independent protein translocase protein TatA
MLADLIARPMETPILAFIGVQELVIVAIIVLVLFGGRLPGVMRSLGKSIPEFKKGMEEDSRDPQSGDAGDKPR